MTTDETVDVLLVEDSAEDLELTSYALTTACGLKFVHLRDGVEALRYIFARRSGLEKRVRQTLKLILLDLKLPKVDGMDVLRKIRADESTRMIPVVMFSSSMQKIDVEAAYHLGVNSYVVKPLEFDKYVRAVSAISSYWSSVNQNLIA
jgi:two-component system, response regulator